MRPANTHPDHDTIAAFRRQHLAAFEAAFLDILLMARQGGRHRVGTMSVDVTKIDTSPSKLKADVGRRVRVDGRRYQPLIAFEGIMERKIKIGSAA